MADRGDARILFRCLTRTEVAIRVKNHSAKLEHVKDAPTLTNTLIAKKDWSTILPLHGGSNERPQWRRQQQAYARKKDVQATLRPGECSQRRSAKLRVTR
jgi:hypothetical protein